MFGTGNPTPAYTTGRGEGDNLYTCSLVAVNVDTGKMAWYYQTSPHDTHDWDSTQTPVFADMPFNGRPRKLVMTRSATATSSFWTASPANIWSPANSASTITGLWAWTPRAAQAQPRQGRNHSRFAGQRRCHELSAANLLAGYRPLLRAREQLAAHHLPDRSRPARLDGPRRHDRGRRSLYGSYIDAIDYRTGKVAWRHDKISGGGRTVVDRRRPAIQRRGQKLVAYEAATGKPLWHSRIGAAVMRPRPTCWTVISTSSPPAAISCTHSS